MSGQRRLPIGTSNPLIDAVLAAARRLTDAYGATVVRREDECSVYLAEDAVEPLWKGERVALDRCPFGRSIASGEPSVIEEVQADTLETYEILRGTPIKSLLAVPAGPDGALGVYFSSHHSPTESQRELLLGLGGIAGVALDTVQFDEALQAAHETAELRARELGEWKRRYEAAIAAGKEIFFEWHVPSGAVVWGGLVEQTLGIAKNEVRPSLSWWLDRVHSDDRRRVREALEHAATSNEPVSLEYRVRHAGDTYLTVHQRGRRFVDATGESRRMVGFITDISDRRQLEAHLRHAQKMEAVGQLAGGVAHDFNNLLVPILAYTEMAAQDLADGDPVKEDLITVLDAANRARDLVGQLLQFSRKQLQEAQDLSLNDEVQKACGILRRVIRENIEVDIDLTELPTRIVGDRTQVQQILMNLAVNAQDAMPEGGTLRIETRQVVTQLGDGLPASLEPGAYLRLSVTDTGTGMDEPTRARIFEPFFTTKPSGKGTGLGLATVYGIVHQHGGEVECLTSPGRGTTFYVYFPQKTAGATAPSSTRAPCSGGKEVILVVEDDDMVREVTRRMLEQLGYTVICAADADSALDAARQHEGGIHLLLTDLVLRKTDGRKLRAELGARYPEIKALYMSGYAPSPLSPEGARPGGPPVLRKPFGLQQLLRAVREAIDGETA